MMQTLKGRRVGTCTAIGLAVACLSSAGAAMPPNTSVSNIDGVEFEVRVSAPASARTVTVEYRVRNTGDVPIAVFDRGDSRVSAKTAPATGRAAAPAPLVERSGNDVDLNHLALALPKPAPTVPRVSLATRVDAGATHEGHFVTTLDASVTRLRYCLGMSPFDAGSFIAQEGAQPPAWRTPFALAKTQRRLCTPWYGVDEKRFES